MGQLPGGNNHHNQFNPAGTPRTPNNFMMGMGQLPGNEAALMNQQLLNAGLNAGTDWNAWYQMAACHTTMQQLNWQAAAHQTVPPQHEGSSSDRATSRWTRTPMAPFIPSPTGQEGDAYNMGETGRAATPPNVDKPNLHDPTPPYICFIGNLWPGTTEDDVRKMLTSRDIYPISVRLIVGPKCIKRRYGYVDFSTYDEMHMALSLDGLETSIGYDGTDIPEQTRPIRVDRASARTPEQVNKFDSARAHQRYRTHGGNHQGKHRRQRNNHHNQFNPAGTPRTPNNFMMGMGHLPGDEAALMNQQLLNAGLNA